MKIFIYIIFVICIALNVTNSAEEEFEKSTITIQTKNSEYIFNVEIAKTAEERSKGLMCIKIAFLPFDLSALYSSILYFFLLLFLQFQH